MRFDENQLDRITIDAPGKDKTVLARKGELWTIANRNNAAANAGEVRRLIDLIAGEQVTKFVEDVASDLPKYGLDKPQLTVTLSSFASENTAETSAGEHPMATIAFGKIDGENVYARVGDEPFVVTARRAMLDNIFSSPLQWQELAIFKFKPEQIHRLSVITDHELTIGRGPSNQWQWVVGNGLIDTGNVQSLLNTLASLRAVRWVGNDVPAQAFARPQLIVTFTTSSDDKTVHKLLVGSPAADNMPLARTDEREGTFVINNPDFNALRLPLVQTPPASPAASTPPASPLPSISPSQRASPGRTGGTSIAPTSATPGP